MASGLAVVAYNYAAAHMHISHGETGVLVPDGDSKAFVDAATNLIRTPQALHKMRWQAHAYAGTIDWQRVVERFATLLTSALVLDPAAPQSSITYRGVAI
jgi:glycosyltransferase involved in cell wall biosynthesis